VQKEHGRIIAIIAMDRDPLRDTPDPDEHFFSDRRALRECGPRETEGRNRQ
jgi:hypothetical protein